MKLWKAWAVVVLAAAIGEPAAGQRLLEEWQVRTTAGPEALVSGASAVFWNPAQVAVAGGTVEALVLDLRAPGITGVDGVAIAAAVALDERTVIALGYEHIGVSGIEHTTDSPDGGTPLDVGEDRFAAAASHLLGERVRIGAMVRYTRLPEVAYTTMSGAATGQARSVIALGAGLRVRPVARLPLSVAAMAATEGSESYWMAGLEFASGLGWAEWRLHGEYGLAGGELAPGVTHRGAARAVWRDHVELTAGAALEPDGDGRSLQPVAGAALSLSRYRLGMVREQLANDFGGAWSFMFSVTF
jgi:hypothetical protein